MVGTCRAELGDLPPTPGAHGGLVPQVPPTLGAYSGSAPALPPTLGAYRGSIPRVPPTPGAYHRSVPALPPTLAAYRGALPNLPPTPGAYRGALPSVAYTLGAYRSSSPYPVPTLGVGMESFFRAAATVARGSGTFPRSVWQVVGLMRSETKPAPVLAKGNCGYPPLRPAVKRVFQLVPDPTTDWKVRSTFQLRPAATHSGSGPCARCPSHSSGARMMSRSSQPSECAMRSAVSSEIEPSLHSAR